MFSYHSLVTFPIVFIRAADLDGAGKAQSHKNASVFKGVDRSFLYIKLRSVGMNKTSPHKSVCLIFFFVDAAHYVTYNDLRTQVVLTYVFFYNLYTVFFHLSTHDALVDDRLSMSFTHWRCGKLVIVL